MKTLLKIFMISFVAFSVFFVIHFFYYGSISAGNVVKNEIRDAVQIAVNVQNVKKTNQDFVVLNEMANPLKIFPSHWNGGDYSSSAIILSFLGYQVFLKPNYNGTFKNINLDSFSIIYTNVSGGSTCEMFLLGLIEIFDYVEIKNEDSNLGQIIRNDFDVDGEIKKNLVEDFYFCKKEKNVIIVGKKLNKDFVVVNKTPWVSLLKYLIGHNYSFFAVPILQKDLLVFLFFCILLFSCLILIFLQEWGFIKNYNKLLLINKEYLFFIKIRFCLFLSFFCCFVFLSFTLNSFLLSGLLFGLGVFFFVAAMVLITDTLKKYKEYNSGEIAFVDENLLSLCVKKGFLVLFWIGCFFSVSLVLCAWFFRFS